MVAAVCAFRFPRLSLDLATEGQRNRLGGDHIMTLTRLRLLGATFMLAALTACGGETAAEAPSEGRATESSDGATVASDAIWVVAAEEGKTVMSLLETPDMEAKKLATLSCVNGSKTIEFEVPGFPRVPEESALTLSPDGGDPVLSIAVPAGGDGFASGSAPLPDDFTRVFAGMHVFVARRSG